MSISGINGTGFLLRSMAKSRIEDGTYSGAVIKEKDGQYIVYFYDRNGKIAETPRGEECFLGSCILETLSPLASTRRPYEPKVFKSIDGAVSDLKQIGVKNIQIVTDE